VPPDPGAICPTGRRQTIFAPLPRSPTPPGRTSNACPARAGRPSSAASSTWVSRPPSVHCRCADVGTEEPRVGPRAPRSDRQIGLNYRSHAEESRLDVPEVSLVFAKWPSALIGHEAPIVTPGARGDRRHHRDSRRVGAPGAAGDALRQFTLGKSSVRSRRWGHACSRRARSISGRSPSRRACPAR
jgi:fumarylacetoacetase-like protein